MYPSLVVAGPARAVRAPRALAALGLLALLLALQVNAASAGISWCRTDPHLLIGGKTTNVFLERAANEANTNSGPIQLEVVVPVGVSTAVVDQDSGFGHGYTVTFKESSALSLTGNVTRIKVRAYVPSDAPMTVRLISEPLANPQWNTWEIGTSNSWVVLDARI